MEKYETLCMHVFGDVWNMYVCMCVGVYGIVYMYVCLSVYVCYVYMLGHMEHVYMYVVGVWNSMPICIYV